MGIFKKRKTADADEVKIESIFKATLLVPKDFPFSEKFISDGSNPLEVERRYVNKVVADPLLSERRLPVFAADSAAEIAYAFIQREERFAQIAYIVMQQNSAKARAQKLLEQIDNEIDAYDQEIKILNDRKNDFSKARY